MPTELGSNDGAFSSFKGDIIADTDAPLISTQSTGGQSYALGSSLSAGIYTMVQNGTFKATPPDPEAAISDPDNSLPYFSLESNYVSGAQITATSVEDSTVASGRKIRFTIPVGTAVGQYLRLVRYVAVPGSVARTFTYQPRSAWKSTSSTTQVVANLQAQFYQNDIATTTGTSQTRASTLATIAASTWAWELFANPGGTPSIPTDAAFIRVAVGVTVDTLTTSEWTVDLHEVRIDHGSIQEMITDQQDPGRYGYAVINMDNGKLNIRSNEAGVVGSSPMVSLYSKQGSIGLDASYEGINQTISAASRAGSTVTITTSAAHDLEVLYWVKVAGLSGAAGTSMNGTFQVLSKTATQFTYTAAGTAGSATVTGATVKTAPAQGNILLTTATNGNVIVNPGGVLVTGTSDFSGDATIGGDLGLSGDLNIGVSDTSVAGAIIFKGGNGGSIRAFSAGAGNDSVAIKNTDGSAYAPLVADTFFPGGQGSFRLDHDGNFDLNDSLDVTGNITATGTMVATGDITGSDVVSNGVFYNDQPLTSTLTTNGVRFTLISGSLFRLDRITSSARFKTDIVDAGSEVLEASRRVHARHYKSTISHENGGTRLGFIAEELMDAGLDHAVGVDEEGRPDTIDPVALIAALWKRVEDLEARLAEVEGV
jgi:hypothetical protein